MPKTRKTRHGGSRRRHRRSRGGDGETDARQQLCRLKATLDSRDGLTGSEMEKFREEVEPGCDERGEGMAGKLCKIAKEVDSAAAAGPHPRRAAVLRKLEAALGSDTCHSAERDFPKRTSAEEEEATRTLQATQEGHEEHLALTAHHSKIDRLVAEGHLTEAQGAKQKALAREGLPRAPALSPLQQGLVKRAQKTHQLQTEAEQRSSALRAAVTAQFPPGEHYQRIGGSRRCARHHKRTHKRTHKRRFRHPKKGQKSRTRRGRKDFTTKRGNKYFNRRGHRQSRSARGSRRRPYRKRR
jgi:hypothetical protein